MDTFVKNGYVDTFRTFHPEPNQYSWWSYRTRARERNVGWRLDYFFATPDIMDNIEDSVILSDVVGSDHCPVGLKLRI
jgi:exodeoxyribonuclease-3